MLQRIGDADLFGSWPIIGASRAVGQVSSRLCPLPELFAFPSPQICASDFLLQPSCDSCWNSTILLSSALAAETLLRSEIFSELHDPKRPSLAAPQFMLRGTYPASQLRAFSSSLGKKTSPARDGLPLRQNQTQASPNGTQRRWRSWKFYRYAKKENRDHSPNLRRAPNPQSFQE